MPRGTPFPHINRELMHGCNHVACSKRRGENFDGKLMESRVCGKHVSECDMLITNQIAN